MILGGESFLLQPFRVELLTLFKDMTMTNDFIYGFGTEDVTIDDLVSYHAKLVNIEGGNDCQCKTCVDFRREHNGDMAKWQTQQT